MATTARYQDKVAEALAKVLAIPEKAPPPRVVIRQYRPGIHHVVPNVLIKDPGNDVEAVVDIKGLSIADVKKLGDNATLEQIDKELKMSLVRDVTTVGLAEVSPTEALESTSSSIQGDFMSLGWHTVCRLNEADTTFDGQGKVRVVHGQSLRQCSIRWAAALVLIWLCLAEEERANCAEEVEREEESETESLRVQLLQQREFRLQRGPLTTAEVPAKQQFSLPVAKAFATVSQAAFCGADEELRNWTCKACRDVGFSLTLGTRRLVRQAELGEADSTFVFVSRAEWMPEKPEEEKDEAGDPAECANATGFIGSELAVSATGVVREMLAAGVAMTKIRWNAVELQPILPIMYAPHQHAMYRSQPLNVSSAASWPSEAPRRLRTLCTMLSFGVTSSQRVLIDNGCIPGTEHGTILLTGHSLGAAVATIGMYMLQLRGYSVGLSYNFESPRVGNEAFHDAFDVMFGRKVDLWRITRSRDPVPHVPPLPIYHHVGSEAYFPKDAKEPVVCLESEDSKCADRYSLLETLIFGWDHCKSEIASPGRGFGEGQNELLHVLLCNDWNIFCYGFEFRSKTGRCEIWTMPICGHSQANVPGSPFVDFRCFKRCHPG
eukprot:s6715_g1.t1